MKLVEKIIGFSGLFVGLILVITIGSDVLDRKVEDSAELIHERANAAEKAAFKAKLYLREETAQLKDYLIIEKSPEKMESYYQNVVTFLLTLKELDTLMIDSSTLGDVHHKHRLFSDLAKQIKKSSLTGSEFQQYYQEIIAHQKQIDSSLNLVISTIEDQDNLSQQNVEQVKELSKIISIVSTIIILIIFLGYLILIAVVRVNRKPDFGSFGYFHDLPP